MFLFFLGHVTRLLVNPGKILMPGLSSKWGGSEHRNSRKWQKERGVAEHKGVFRARLCLILICSLFNDGQWWPMLRKSAHEMAKSRLTGLARGDWRLCEVLPVTYTQSDLLQWTMIRIERIPEYNGTTVSTVVSGRFGHPAKDSENLSFGEVLCWFAQVI